MSQKLAAKISVASIYGKIDRKKLAALPEGEVMPIMRVLGQASGLKHGVSNFGEWVAFFGNFKAINIETGEETRGAKLFLPTVASDLLTGAVVNGQMVDFAFDVGVVFDNTVQIGYRYVVVPLLQASETDPVAILEKQLKALAAPKSEEKPKGKK